MMIIVDTCIWSLALRRTSAINNSALHELQELIAEFRVQLIGPIRQELLTGIRSDEQFEKLKRYLAAFKDLSLDSIVFEQAAEFSNKCKSRGIQGSPTDFLLCSVSTRYEMPIFTIDKDFENYKKILPFNLHIPRSSGR